MLRPDVDLSLPMKVLCITDIYPSATNPFKGNFVKQQVEQVSRLFGVKFTVVHLDKRPASIGGILQMAAAMFRLPFQYVFGGYDIIHVHYGLTAPAAFLLPKKKTLISFYGCDVNLPATRRISGIFSRGMRARIFVSEKLRGKLPGPATYVIPNGVDSVRFSPRDMGECKRRLGLDSAKKYFIFPSNPASESKNYPLFKGILDILKRHDSSVEEVVMNGTITDDDLPLYYSAAHGMIMTSTREGSPISTKEALMANLPVFCTQVGDIAEQFAGVDGALVIPWEVEKAAAVVAGYMKDYRRSNGRIKIPDYALESEARKIYEVYQSPLGT